MARTELVRIETSLNTLSIDADEMFNDVVNQYILHMARLLQELYKLKEDECQALTLKQHTEMLYEETERLYRHFSAQRNKEIQMRGN